MKDLALRRLLVLAPSLRDTSPGSRFRIEQWMPLFERAGVECTYSSFEDEELHDIIYSYGNYARKARSVLHAFGRRFGLLPGLRRYDAVFIYEEVSRLGPAVIERLIHRLGVPIVYDFCDPIWIPFASSRNKFFNRLKFVGKTATICRLASHVLVGNPELADYARQYSQNVTIVPITIDTDLYTVRKEPELPAGGDLVIGWSGSHSTVRCLDELRPALQKLHAQRPFELRVIGEPGYALDGVSVRALPWRAATEVADLHGFDIGIMPLPDEPWVRLRTHLKMRQYMGIGIPCVASPLGVMTEVIQDGENGFLAATEAEWIEKLSRLAGDAALRRKMGAAGRKTIEERYSAKLWAPRVLDLVKEAVSRANSGS